MSIELQLAIQNLNARYGAAIDADKLEAWPDFFTDDGRYLLASYYQEVLKYVAVGQPVEVALNLYPGQILKGKVAAIWTANGDGQFLPSGTLPKFEPPVPESPPQNLYAVNRLSDEVLGAECQRILLGFSRIVRGKNQDRHEVSVAHPGPKLLE